MRGKDSLGRRPCCEQHGRAASAGVAGGCCGVGEAVRPCVITRARRLECCGSGVAAEIWHTGIGEAARLGYFIGSVALCCKGGGGELGRVDYQA
mmetsp:Transcript_10725/g.24674  ORF Transcript_10725/g.24674 Transcript_10725/m.24674 type:complete len:94 (+) Transcript_10725:901-1182(+)